MEAFQQVADGGAAPGVHHTRRAARVWSRPWRWRGTAGAKPPAPPAVAIPWLQKAARVVILAAPAATPRDFDPGRLMEHFAERGVKAEVETLAQSGDPGPDPARRREGRRGVHR